ncbi:helix-turn-helix transcriptional regulator [Kocuria arenosa]|uniref:helix-turn-helix transcriptional regulator n=1 Tax=Kocuria arenosa TaxID=3071446 RepID=UPI0034D552C8
MTTKPPAVAASKAATKNTPTPVLLTTAQVSAMLGITVRTLANWRCAGTGPRAVVGRSTGGVRYHRADVETWIRNEWGVSTMA